MTELYRINFKSQWEEIQLLHSDACQLKDKCNIRLKMEFELYLS